MATMAAFSRSTLRQSPDRNVVTASPEERTSVWSSLPQRLERYPFTPLVPAEIQRVGTTWIRQCFTLAESSSQVGSHLTRYGRISNLLIVPVKSCAHDNRGNSCCRHHRALAGGTSTSSLHMGPR